MEKQNSKHYDNHFTRSFANLQEPRRTKKGNFMYPLSEILFLCISAVICGYTSTEDIASFGEEKLEWLRKFMPFTNGTPSHDTIGKVFQRLDPNCFNECFIAWTSSLPCFGGSLIHIDGKTVKGSSKHKKNPIHIVSAFASERGLTLGQKTVCEKSNEITAIPELLDLIAKEGMIITTDAMGCQTEIAKKIKDECGDYVLQVKGNQGKLLEEMQIQFSTDCINTSHISENRGHGRKETRVCETIKVTDKIPCIERWEGIENFVRVTTQTIDIKTGKDTTDTRYYISSLEADGKRFNEIIRAHWSIENNLHWVLDVQFNEDNQRRKKDHGATNLNMIYKFGLNLMNLHKTPKLKLSKIKLKSTLSDEFREKIMGLSNNI